jgi:hypothetical protein
MNICQLENPRHRTRWPSSDEVAVSVDGLAAATDEVAVSVDGLAAATDEVAVVTDKLAVTTDERTSGARERGMRDG